MALLLMLLYLAAVLFAWFSLVYLIPWTLRDMFSHRLWRLRDQLADEIFAGAYQDPQRAKLLLAQIQMLNERREDISPGKIWLLRANDPSALLASSVEPLVGLAEEDEPQLKEHATTLLRLINHHARFETPSGWLTCLLLHEPVKPKDIGRLLGLDRQRDVIDRELADLTELQ